MPATTWLGLTDTPGQAGRYAAIDAATIRDLAAALAARSDSRWCLTLTDRHGRAIAHGCARAGPGPPATADPGAWLRQITITSLETGTCAHRRQTPAYRPPDSLRHLIKIRDRGAQRVKSMTPRFVITLINHGHTFALPWLSGIANKAWVTAFP